MHVELIIVFVGILIFLAHLFVGIFSKTRVPDVLLLIIIGLFVGPVLKIVTPAHFGVVGPIFTTITLIIILFEGGIGLNIEVLKESLKGTLKLTAVGFIISTITIGIVAFLIIGLSPLMALMLGSALGGTSSVVVVPLIRQLKMQDKSKTILLLESALTDVLCIVFALAFIEAYKLGELRVGIMLGQTISSFVLAGFLGVLAGFLWSIALHKIRNIQNSIFTTPAFVFVVFGIAELLGYSGAIASLSFGITLGNIESFQIPFLKRYISTEPIGFNEIEKVFFSEVVFLLKTFFFVYIGLSIKFSDLWLISVGLFVALAVFVIRIPVVKFSIQKTTPAIDASIMAIMVPKGLAPAVLASIPLQQGIPNGEIIQSVTYSAILFSILFTSIFIFLMDKTKLSKLYGWIFSSFAKYIEQSVENYKSTNEVINKK